MNFRIRLTALVPVLLSLVAFILSMLCIFAGSKKGYLESANLLTVSILTKFDLYLITTDLLHSSIHL